MAAMKHHVCSLNYVLFFISINLLLFQIVPMKVTRGCDLLPEAPVVNTDDSPFAGGARQHFLSTVLMVS